MRWACFGLRPGAGCIAVTNASSAGVKVAVYGAQDRYFSHPVGAGFLCSGETMRVAIPPPGRASRVVVFERAGASGSTACVVRAGHELTIRAADFRTGA